MPYHFRARFVLFSLSFVLAAAALAANPKGGSYNVASSALGGDERYLAHVSTDKPIYREGETVYLRAVVLNARTSAPYRQPSGLSADVLIKGPKGDTVASGLAYVKDSVMGFGWQVPEGTPGGEYTASVRVRELGLAPALRKFDVRVFRAPRLSSEITFARDGYGPGDEVLAKLHVTRAEGGVPRGAKVKVSARVDGAEVYTGATRVDEVGDASASFALPKRIERGEGTIAMSIEDGGVIETAAKTIPILLQTLDLSMYPEGGELVAGLPARLYVEAKTPAGKPADIEAAIIDERGVKVARFATEHEGRGRVSFTPEARAYALAILSPAGITRTFPLPEVAKSGAVLASLDDIVAPRKRPRLRISASAAGEYTVTIAKRELELARAAVQVRKGGFFSRLTSRSKPTEVALELPDDAEGVLTATLWGPKDEPLAERLIFREPHKAIKVAIKTDKQSYVPGGEAALEIRTTGADGKPTSAVVGITVTDNSVLEMIEKREQAPRLPVMVLLEPEVQELADAHVYLDPRDKKAPLALDLLLGTQGWRRFALRDVEDFRESEGDAALRALAVQEPVVLRRAHLRQNGAAEMEDAAVPMMAAGAPPARDLRAPRGVPRAPPPPPAVVKAAPRPVVLAPKLAPALEPARKRRMPAVAVLREEERILANEAPAIAYVREYAHRVRPGRSPADRSDFTETLYWNAGVRTNKDGIAKVRFGLSDAVTSFKIAADAFADDGALGSGTRMLQSLQPFYVEPKVPLQLTSGDIAALPVAFVNGTQSELSVSRLEVRAAKGLPRPRAARHGRLRRQGGARGRRAGGRS